MGGRRAQWVAILSPLTTEHCLFNSQGFLHGEWRISLPLSQADWLSLPLALSGQKTCLHLHGIFPYLYVPYDGYGQQADRYLRQVAFSVDRALNVSMGNPSSNTQHVFKVALVSGM